MPFHEPAADDSIFTARFASDSWENISSMIREVRRISGYGMGTGPFSVANTIFYPICVRPWEGDCINCV